MPWRPRGRQRGGGQRRHPAPRASRVLAAAAAALLLLGCTAAPGARLCSTGGAAARAAPAPVPRPVRGPGQESSGAHAAAAGAPWAPHGRRAGVGAGLSALLGAGAPRPAVAEGPKVTAKCSFDVRVGNEKFSKMRKLVIGLFGEEAPRMTQTFVEACTGTYPGEAGRQAYYKLADVKSIEKNKAIVWADFKDGNTISEVLTTYDSRWVGTKVVNKPLAGDDTRTDQVNNLVHDVPGRVSMRRGGGTFDFAVAPVANAKWLDKTNVVIGQVLEGMDIISDINEIKMYGSKPLKKVRIFNSTLLDGAG